MRRASLAAALTILLLLTGCGQAAADVEPEPEESAAPPPVVLYAGEASPLTLTALRAETGADGAKSLRLSCESARALKSVEVRVYTLMDGEWMLCSNVISLPFEAEEGELALSWSALNDGVAVSVPGGEVKFTMGLEIDGSNAASELEGAVEASAGENIPVAMQVYDVRELTDVALSESGPVELDASLDGFRDPGRFESFHRAYVLTLCFRAAEAD